MLGRYVNVLYTVTRGCNIVLHTAIAHRLHVLLLFYVIVRVHCVIVCVHCDHVIDLGRKRHADWCVCERRVRRSGRGQWACVLVLGVLQVSTTTLSTMT